MKLLRKRQVDQRTGEKDIPMGGEPGALIELRQVVKIV